MKSILFLAGMLLCMSVSAFNNEREGFVLGLGIGIANIDYDSGSFSASDTGIATSLKIGYGFTNDFSLYYLRNATFSEEEGYSFAEGITGIGVSKYLNPHGASLYFLGSLGIGDLINLDESETETGSAYLLGLGYEFHNHSSVEFTILKTKIDDVDYNSTALQLTYNYTFY